MEVASIRTFLIIWVFYINNGLCEDKRVFLKSYPKKVLPFGKVYIVNSGKIVNTKPLNTKKTYNDKMYTVFESVGANSKKINVPESRYFPLEQSYDNRPRVKKVLPDYVWTSLRNKRSVREKHDILAKDNHHKAKVHKKNNSQQLKFISVGKKANLDKENVGRHSKSSSKLLKSKHHKRTGLKYPKKPSKRSKRNKNKNSKPQTHNKHKSSVRKGKKTSGKSHAHHGKVPFDARRLIAGKDATIDDYPYVVSIQKSREHWCAGALLNPRLVITTANCLWKSSSISSLRVRAGSRHTDRGGQVAKIQEVMKHPGWGIRRGPDNDVALALLDKNIRFSDSVHGVDLPNRMMMPAFEDAFITSWGSTRVRYGDCVTYPKDRLVSADGTWKWHDETMMAQFKACTDSASLDRDGVFEPTDTTSLQVYHARLLDRGICNNITQRFGVIVTENFICLTQTGRQAPCTRDTGAPAVSDGVLWGLASWGIRKLCGTERFPAMFSYIASQSNMDFIENATHYLMADKRLYPFPDRAPRMRITTTKPTTASQSFI